MHCDALRSPSSTAEAAAAEACYAEKLISSVDHVSRHRTRDLRARRLYDSQLSKNKSIAPSFNLYLEHRQVGGGGGGGGGSGGGGGTTLRTLHTYREACSPIPTSYFEMSSENNILKPEKINKHCTKSDKATLIITNTSSEESIACGGAGGAGGGGGGGGSRGAQSGGEGRFEYLNRRIDTLEMRVERQDTAFRGLRPADARGGSLVGQYSRVPDTPPALRHLAGRASPAPAPLPAPADEERYGRELAAYDGITDARQRRASGGGARARRESASMPVERAETAAEASATSPRARPARDPVRDYRLADTVHYLAQGEFAPRSDGIKLTPSREAVLSDIIWEDVCRSHWPTARLANVAGGGPRRRLASRGDLQRHIDALLRDRIAHNERRRRRHYRVMKMNHGKELGKIVGKTGDVIVASGLESAGPSSGERAPAGGGARGAGGARSARRGTVEEHYIMLPTLVVTTSARRAAASCGLERARAAAAPPVLGDEAPISERCGDSSEDSSR